MNTAERPKLEAPGQVKKVLLHSCCAPCEGEVLETMVDSGITPTVFFYNPNIHPKKEYELRKVEDKRFCEKLGLEHHDGDYDVRNWFDRVKGMEWEPERGIRCTTCFDMRFERTALFAHEHGFSVFTSCLGISRWKNMAQINGCGERAAARYEGMTYWKFRSGRIFTSRSTAGACSLCGIPMSGGCPRGVRKSKLGKISTARKLAKNLTRKNCHHAVGCK
jgi:predicted adenine nucleotide alpha hydrolase (AANH) superfamily ATPase